MFNQEEQRTLTEALSRMGIMNSSEINQLVTLFGSYSQQLVSCFDQFIYQLDGIERQLGRDKNKNAFDEVYRFAIECADIFEDKCCTDNEDNEDDDDEDDDEYF